MEVREYLFGCFLFALVVVKITFMTFLEFVLDCRIAFSNCLLICLNTQIRAMRGMEFGFVKISLAGQGKASIFLAVHDAMGFPCHDLLRSFHRAR